VTITRLDETFRDWVDYANASQSRGRLETLHKKKWIEYDHLGRRATVSPTGAPYVETSITL